MDRARVVDFYLQKINDKDFTILQVRQELEKSKIDEEEIKIIVRLVDNALQRRLVNIAANGKSRELIWIGGAITLVGSLVTILTYTGLIDMGNHFLVAYGPVLGGLSILIYGLGRRKQT